MMRFSCQQDFRLPLSAQRRQRRLSMLLAMAPALVACDCSWRQTGGCDPNGPREATFDRPCDALVPPGASGYCECDSGERVAQSTCDHDQFTCDLECKNAARRSRLLNSDAPCADGSARRNDGTCANPASAPQQQQQQQQTSLAKDAPVEQEYRCLAWRQTHGCDANGRRDRTKDLGCDANVPSGVSGFCECEGLADGKPHRVRLSSCDHMPFKCAAECARAAFYSCDGWRQTADCKPDGPREEQQDAPCAQSVRGGVSGYCECGGAAHSRRVPRPPGCSADDAAESCDAVCKRGETLYSMLGLHDGAPEAAAKKEFRKLSLKLHPDKQRSAEKKEAAAARFAEVREAFDILSDPDARILYDMHGCEAAAGKAGKEREGGSEVGVEVPLAEAYNGAQRYLDISRRVVCKGCAAGSGGASRPRCRRCGDCPPEVKNVNVQFAPGFVVQQPQEVPSEERCEQQQYRLDYDVRPGMADGEKITFARAGEQRPGRIPGDVVLKVSVGSSAEVRVVGTRGESRVATLRRRGRNDLHVDLRISLREALLGWNATLTHLDGHAVSIRREGGASGSVTAPGAVLRIPGEGLPQADAEGVVDARKTGTLQVKVSVDFPDRLSEEAAAWASGALQP